MDFKTKAKLRFFNMKIQGYGLLENGCVFTYVYCNVDKVIVGSYVGYL